ncbi:MAG: Hpt domain-containing protein [FCB group bacterium]|jgi:two-component system chemotaxis sensor kinase CheA|nr:Hpt domain-containing protein [FCB group bacterium]
MEKDLEYYRRQFYLEARELLEKANEDLLRAEQDPGDQELLNSIFRGVHTIKGSAGGFELDAVSAFAHHLESLLGAVRDGTIALEPEVVDIALQACDVLLGMINAFENGSAVAGDDALVARIRAYISDATAQEAPAAAPTAFEPVVLVSESDSMPEPFARDLERVLTAGIKVYKITTRYTDETHENGYDQAVFMKNIEEACALYHAVTDEAELPGLAEFNPLRLFLHPVLYTATDLSADEIRDFALEPEFVDVRELHTASTPYAAEREELSERIDGIDDDILNEFMIPAREGLDALEGALLRYEREGCRESLNEMFRVVHTIKGDAGYLNLSSLVRFLHDLESLLEGLKLNTCAGSGRTTDVVLRAIDNLKNILSQLNERNGPVSLTEPYHALRQHLAVLSGQQGGREAIEPFATLDEETRTTFVEQMRQYHEILVRFAQPLVPDAHSRKTAVRALEGIQQAAKFVGITTLTVLVKQSMDALTQEDPESFGRATGEIIAFIRGLTEDRKRIGELLVADGKVTAADVEEALSLQKNLGDILVQSGKVSSADVAQAVRKQELMDVGRQLRPETGEKQSDVSTMRVDEHKIEEFSTILGELVIARNTYDYLIQQAVTAPRGDTSFLKAFKDNLHLLSRLTNEMQMGVMAMRMVPVKGIFQKFQRVLRDISRKQKKQIDMITHGDETEVDKKVADMLSDPLVHLVRNACDHGIESPEVRRKAGKPETGTLILKASQEGRNLIIKVIDDGKGLNRQRIYDKAKAMGVDVCSPDDDGIFNLIFLPGLSTKAEVSDISGRGVGMDVVRSMVQSLGGDVRVMSEAGLGTEVTLTIPMAMGITSALMVESLGKHYAIPLECVVETIKVKTERLTRILEGWGTFYRGEVLPVMHLDTMLTGGNGTATDTDAHDGVAELSLAVLRTGMGKLGVVVDRLNRNMEIAIKPVPPQLSSITSISGVSIMGDGRVVLVLNPDGML